MDHHWWLRREGRKKEREPFVGVTLHAEDDFLGGGGGDIFRAGILRRRPIHDGSLVSLGSLCSSQHALFYSSTSGVPFFCSSSVLFLGGNRVCMSHERSSAYTQLGLAWICTYIHA